MAKELDNFEDEEMNIFDEKVKHFQKWPFALK